MLRRIKKRRTVRTPKVLKASKRQTGKSHLKADKRRQALKPGKRVSKTGKIYYEYRRNRSEVGKKL